MQLHTLAKMGKYSFFTKPIIALINFYQIFLSFDRGLLSVLAPGGACRYSISCSEYTKQMILKEGILTGVYLGIERILSCR